MTGRTVLNEQLRRTMRPAHIGLAIFVLAGLGSQLLGTPGWVTALGLTGFVVAFVCTAIAWLRVRCPTCGERLYYLLSHNGLLRRVDPRIKCCPYCTNDLDAQLAAK